MALTLAWHDYMGIVYEKQESRSATTFCGPQRPRGVLKTRVPSKKGRHSWALWLPILLEEGCHSAKLHTTIHDGHHLLLSIGWQLVEIPHAVKQVSHSLNWMSIG